MLQQQFPTVMVPAKQALETLSKDGHRFLMAKNGVWLDIKRPWLLATVPVATNLPVPLPYGELVAKALINPVPYELIKAFQEFARTQLPNECAAHIILNKTTGGMRLKTLKPTSAGAGHVDFNIDPLDSDEVLVLDIHSHGYFDVFFSDKDNLDDKGDVKIAGVIGFSTREPENGCKGLFRLCLNGLFLQLQVELKDGHYHFSLEE